MDRDTLIQYLKTLDANLKKPAKLYIYGSAALMLLEEEMRISLDIDVAAPYSEVDFADFQHACESAGIPLNPSADYASEHIEWIGPLRLCLPKPDPKTDLMLWRGAKLAVHTASPAKLAASKLVRYDETDQTDIHFLCFQFRLDFDQICRAVEVLPPPFNTDILVLENLENLRIDMQQWRQHDECQR